MTRPARLSREAKRIFTKLDTIRVLSALSLVEMAIKIQQHKLDLTKEQIRQEIDESQIQVLPYHAAHAYTYFDLPMYHPDPFDRQIIAQAIAENIPIVTPDEAFEKYPVKIIW
jgi:PIN domain nuclease of toxin-antitoxin system